VSTQDPSRSSRSWLVAVPTAVLILLGLIWSGFWYYSSTKAEATMTAWRAREAEAGRVYGCADARFGGYPFRIEVSCADPSVDDHHTALSIRARNLAAVAQVWDPTLVIGEIAAPVTIGPLGGSPTATIDWTLAQASLRGAPGAPERLSLVIEKPSLGSVPSSAGVPLLQAEHMEFHARFAAESTPGHPVLDLALNLASFTAPSLANVLGAPFGAMVSGSTDAAITAVLRGTSDLTPKPLAQRLRELQAANGRLDIASARLQQGDLIASATGALTLTPRGTLSGEMRLTIVNFAKLVPLLGIDRAMAQAVPQDKLARYAPGLDRLMPGLGNMLRGGGGGNAGGNASGSVDANASAAALGAVALGGKPTEFEGQQAVTLALRLDDGNIFLGSLKVGQIPPLF